jgi:Bacterial protein of unknown function (DUF922)
MPSKLENAERVLSWADFKVIERDQEKKRSEMTDEEKERDKEDAAIGVYYEWKTVPFETVPGTRPPRFRVKDEIVVRVFNKPDETFVKRRAVEASQRQKDALLAHEQGHYDIAALLARDLFVDLVTLAGREFADVTAVRTAIAAKVDPFKGKLNAVQKLYDDDTKHGAQDARQKEWETLIGRARTEPRTPRALGREGQPLRQTLLQAMRDAGKTL